MTTIPRRTVLALPFALLAAPAVASPVGADRLYTPVPEEGVTVHLPTSFFRCQDHRASVQPEFARWNQAHYCITKRTFAAFFWRNDEGGIWRIPGTELVMYATANVGQPRSQFEEQVRRLLYVTSDTPLYILHGYNQERTHLNTYIWYYEYQVRKVITFSGVPRGSRS